MEVGRTGDVSVKEEHFEHFWGPVSEVPGRTWGDAESSGQCWGGAAPVAVFCSRFQSLNLLSGQYGKKTNTGSSGLFCLCILDNMIFNIKLNY